MSAEGEVGEEKDNEGVYISIKASLPAIIINPGDLKKIQDIVEDTHVIRSHASRFLKIHLLDKYDIRSLTAQMRDDNRRSTDTTPRRRSTDAEPRRRANDAPPGDTNDRAAGSS